MIRAQCIKCFLMTCFTQPETFFNERSDFFAVYKQPSEARASNIALTSGTPPCCYQPWTSLVNTNLRDKDLKEGIKLCSHPTHMDHLCLCSYPCSSVSICTYTAAVCASRAVTCCKGQCIRLCPHPNRPYTQIRKRRDTQMEHQLSQASSIGALDTV